ncbi:hypothetical protein FRB93_001098 [Tulasnella sp. JGI-2019a]|nr:hypothetical protein FRB93_001098 [Tulasnella sp. JGI-2019a]
MSDLPLGAANLIGFLVGMILYGLYVGLFVGAIGIQWVRRKTSPVVAWVTIILFLTTTVNAALIASDAFNAWIKYGADPGGAAYFRDMWTPIKPLRQFFIAVVASTADILLLWRLYVIWSGRLSVVIGPAIILFVEITSAIILDALTWHFVPAQASPAHQRLAVEGFVFVVGVTVLFNIVCTGLIIARLWYVGRNYATQGRSLYKSIIVSLVESGALYTVTMILNIVFAVTPGCAGLYAFISYVLVMMIPIASMLIVNHVTDRIITPEHSRDIKMGRISVVNRENTNTYPSNFLQIQSRHQNQTNTDGARDIIISVEQETYRSSVSQGNLHDSPNIRSKPGNDVKPQLDSGEESERQTQISDDDDKGFDQEEDDDVHPFPRSGLAIAVDLQNRAERGDK